MISSDEIEQYRRDGVICLRQVFETSWIEVAREGIRRNLENPGPFFRDHTEPGSPGRYVFDFWNWRDVPEFERFIFDSPLAYLGETILDTKPVRLLMDNWFLHEAGATNGAPWHHDEPYFDFEGRMCIVWIPLESVRSDQGLTFVSGSHDWGQLYVAQQFSENVPFDCTGDAYLPMPDFDSADVDYRFVSWDLQPGDCLVFDFRTIHSAAKQEQSGSSTTTHRMTFRMGGSDVVFRPRGEWTREISEHLRRLGQRENQPLDNPLTPVIDRLI